MKTLFTLIILLLIAVGAYWYFGPLSSSDAPYWAKLNNTLPEQYRKPEVQPQ